MKDWHVLYKTWTWSFWDLRILFQWIWEVGDGNPWLSVNQTRHHSGRIWIPMPLGHFYCRRQGPLVAYCRLRDRYQLLVCRYDTEVTHTFRQRIDEKRTQQTKMQIYALFCTSHGMCPGRIGILRENKTLSKSDSKFHEKGQINKGTCVNSNKK